jgi:signal transduction histidine kinase
LNSTAGLPVAPRLAAGAAVLCALAFGLAAGFVGLAAAGPELITRAADILRLPRATTARQIPVRLRGVVTLHDTAGQLLFVQDPSAGIYIWGRAGSDLNPGDDVEVEGTTAPGRFSPIVSLASARVMGRAALPQPRRVSLEEIDSGALDSQWVEVEAVVRGQSQEGDLPSLRLASATARLPALLYSNGQPLRTNLVDARIRLRGVAATRFGHDAQVLGFHLLVPGPEHLAVIEPGAADPFARPPASIESLRARRYPPDTDRRIRVQGVVTLHRPGRMLVVQDGTGAVEVRGPIAGSFAPGDVVEVAGFRGGDRNAPWLEEAEVRRADPPGKGGPEQPGAPGAPTMTAPPVLPAQPGGIASTNLPAGPVLVQLEATLLQTRLGAGSETTLGLAWDHQLVEVNLPDGAASRPQVAWAPGARVRVVGVWDAASGSPSGAQGGMHTGPARLWLRSLDDLQILAPPPFRWAGHGLALLAALAGAGLAGWSWHVRRRTEATLRRQEHELRQAFEERERLARDLHDNLIQSIYAVGLRLEESQRRVADEPQRVKDALAQSLGVLNRLIRDARGFIDGLRPQTVSGGELEAALKSMVILMAQPHGPRFIVHVDPEAARALDSNQATHLLHVAREAMSNASRHSQARQCSVRLEHRAGLRQFEIRDDGVGFVLDAADRPGYGLGNMRARARDLSATFRVDTAPGVGTSIRLELPPDPSR